MAHFQTKKAIVKIPFQGGSVPNIIPHYFVVKPSVVSFTLGDGTPLMGVIWGEDTLNAPGVAIYAKVAEVYDDVTIEMVGFLEIEETTVTIKECK